MLPPCQDPAISHIEWDKQVAEGFAYQDQEKTGPAEASIPPLWQDWSL